MKTQNGRTVLAAVAIALVIAAPSFFAQSPLLSATIPFDFYIADKYFPAGTYTVAPQQNMEAIRVFDSRGNSMFVLTSSQSENRSVDWSRLVFHRYGDTTFLASIYWEGYRTGRDLAPSKTEKKLAGIGSSPNPVAVHLK